MKQKYTCKYCKKKFIGYTYRKRKYCSRSCRSKVSCKIAHKTQKRLKLGFYDPKVQSMGGKKAQKIFKKLKKGFYNSKFQSKMSKRGHKTMKRLKLGFYDTKVQSMGGKASCKKIHKICKKNKTGFWNPELQSTNGKKAQKTLKRLKVGAFYDPKLLTKIRKKGGEISIKKQREIRSFPKYKNIIFDSKSEMKVAKKLVKKFNWKPIQNITTHVTIGKYEYDFLINNTFIEYHPFDIQNRTLNKYYEIRRQNLNNVGFSNHNLIVVKHVNDVDKMNLTGEGVMEGIINV